MKTCRFLTAFSIAGVVLLAGPARAAVPASAAPSIADQGQQQTEKFSKTVPLAKGGTFDLSNISGNIVITGGSGDQVVIDAVKKGKNADEFKDVTIEVTATANRVDVRTRYPEGRRNISVSVDYTVTVPRSAAVNVKSISGDEKLTGLDGELHANTISGSLSVTAASDVRSVKSISGDVHLTTAKSSGTLTVGSISGGVTLKDVKAGEIQISSISGDVKAEEVTSNRVSAKSISGEIAFAGPLAKGGRYELTSHSGDVNVYTSDKVGIEVSASTFSGDITSDLVLTSKFGGDTPAGRGRRMRQSVQGTFGDGSAVLQLSSFSGNIRIVKR
jgi:DUF4097 and DUF4098 domain-containing protein YvlB